MDDCLIVGGGVIGLSLAYELSRHGLRIRVVDRGPPGKEASWAGAGILPPANRRTAIHPLDQLRGLSFELHPQWAAALHDETGIDTGYRKCGGIYLARSSGEAASLHGMWGLLREEAIRVERLSAGQVVELEPALDEVVRAGTFKAAYLLPDEAQLRNPDHLRALVAACCRRGVEITSGVSVKHFDIAAGRLHRVHTTAGTYAAERFCVASGAWTRLLLEKLGISNGIMPIRGQMVMFACQRRPFRHILNEGSRYLVPRDDGRVLAGSTEEEVGFDKSTTEQALTELTALGRELVPELRQAPVQRTWAGLRPGSYDGFPYLGAIPGLNNAFAAAGHFRSGLFLSPGTAVIIGELLRGEVSQIDLTPFRVGRG